MRQGLRSLCMLLLPLLCHLAAVFLLGEWIIDDAGISYAYARNFSEGLGLVPQPGHAPVEGFSNFLWVMLLVPFFKLGIFHPVWVPKFLAFLLVGGGLFILQRHAARAFNKSSYLATLGSGLFLLAPPVVIWTTSGLENSLTLFLACLLFHFMLAQPRYWREKSGVLVALLGMTHPEGAIFLLPSCGLAFFSFPLWRQRVMGAGRVIAAFALVYVPFMLFRYATFSLWWPHSFYAKRTHDGIFSTVYDMLTSPGALVDKIYSAVSAPFGSFGLWFFVAQLIGLFYLRKTHQLARIHLVGLLLQLTGLAAFIFLDHDWMGEFRFATIFTVFSLSLLLWTIARLPARISHLIAAVCTLLLLGNFGLRLLNFAAKPTVPFAGIARNKAEKYNRYKEIIGGNEISVLTYDLGAVLYYAQMKVYDLAGLCDTETVKYLKKGTIFWLDDHPEFYDYVFSEIKPTLIETSGFFTHITAFDKDPRFSRDYSAIDGFGDYTYLGEHSGIFVRKDALTRPGLLQDLQNGYQPGPISLPLLLRLEELLGFATPALSQEVGMERGLFFQMKKNNLWRAERSYRQVLALNPEHFGALFRLAKVLDAQERTFEARPYWERVRERAEASRDALVLEDARTRLR